MTPPDCQLPMRARTGPGAHRRTMRRTRRAPGGSAGGRACAPSDNARQINASPSPILRTDGRRARDATVVFLTTYDADQPSMCLQCLTGRAVLDTFDVYR